MVVIKHGNVRVSPQFDSGNYKHRFAITDDDNFFEEKFTKEDFKIISMLIASVVNVYINNK